MNQQNQGGQQNNPNDQQTQKPGQGGQQGGIQNKKAGRPFQPKGEDAAERYDNGPCGNQPSFSLSALSVLSAAGFDSFALSQQVVGCCDCLPVQLSD